MVKKVLLILVIAFALNAAWENVHSQLYEHYKGGEITQFILLRATAADAVMIGVITAPWVIWRREKKYSWLIILLGVGLAIGIEKWALATGRWDYNEYMPVIPLLGVGLTPTIQLGLLGYLAWQLQEKMKTDPKEDR
jgi:hypothetical protein